MELATIYQPIREDLPKVEKVLRTFYSGDMPEMVEPLEPVLGDGGKRIRPALSLLAGKLNHYDEDLLLPLAVAVELLHTATLIHDDAIDHSELRRGKPTINSLWGWQTAVILGDYLFASSADLVSTTGNVKVMRLFAQSLMILSSGELKQYISAFQLDQNREHYYQRIGRKTASLFSMASECGAILSGCSEQVSSCLKDYGHNVGLAYQIVDDILDFVGDEAEMGKPIGSDLLQGTLTLPTILLIEHYPGDNPVKKLFENRQDHHSLEQAVDMIRNSGIIEGCYQVASDFCSRACAGLKGLPATASSRALQELAEYVVRRRK